MISSKDNTIIESLGVYLPPRAVSTQEVLAGCKKQIAFPLEQMTGIKTRRMAGHSEFSIDLAQKAVEDCLAFSKYRPKDFGLLICCNISRCDGPNLRFSFEPSTSVRIKQHFGFTNALVFDISNACAGMFTGVLIVNTLLSLGAIECGMVVSGEYITHLTQTAQNEIESFMDPRLACLTLGDAGVAISLEKSPDPELGFQILDMYTLGRYFPLCIAKATNQAHGGAIMLTDSIKLTAVTLKNSIMHTEHVRSQIGWSPDAFDHLIMHQTSKLTIENAIREINNYYHRGICHEGNVPNILPERGNTASTSYFVALKDKILDQTINSGDHLLFSITGSGLTIGTAIYTLDSLPDRIRQKKSLKPNLETELPEKENPTIVNPRRPNPMDFKVQIRGVGTSTAGKTLERDSTKLVSRAAEVCLEKSALEHDDIDIILYAGVYRSDFIYEPAIATILAGTLRINDLVENPNGKKTLAFDIFNGAIGYLNACYLATCMIEAGKAANVMIVAAEIESNAEISPEDLLGISETGSAVILSKADSHNSGFGGFVFGYSTGKMDARVVYSRSKSGKLYLIMEESKEIEDFFLELIPQTVNEALKRENLDVSRINVVFPPQFSSNFILRLSNLLGIPRGKFIDVVEEGKDLFTSSIAFSLASAFDNQVVKEGDIGLIISVGSGIQVGCAVYYF